MKPSIRALDCSVDMVDCTSNVKHIVFCIALPLKMKKEANNTDKHTHMAELMYKTKTDENNLRRLDISSPMVKSLKGVIQDPALLIRPRKKFEKLFHLSQ